MSKKNVTLLSAPCLTDGIDCKECDEPLSLVKGVISETPVLVFSKSYCPFCTKTKNAFEKAGIPYTLVELDHVKRGPEIQAALTKLTGQRTVPNVFIGKQHIGGASDTLEGLASGKLGPLLKEAGVERK
mmetsp:Transcript_21712/g.29839  ORF Transcript_21712/g.29839 Transcript_21712/m.29839 type:complete len:129 (-) Transcript_21712:41-427(-)|eukprot:CAMPEP_0201480444 /NCGR_PEP_ID=MMETSP0151_2-20130828/4928_1 /ASSEMBLY_ACC=CAM_ASM_000257 /TAXON_ID=200890 /ORGANISM="Paramoeba atlantica, Strain 621/1 / CCAP 1560/9" /LENGTH=128 /DNA_ID=CAMNT_0047862297 /DNA_START=19 /DNA_END=405 /DNA_ORIENTATION=-